jgi:hypothetical protein
VPFLSFDPRCAGRAGAAGEVLSEVPVSSAFAVFEEGVVLDEEVADAVGSIFFRSFLAFFAGLFAKPAGMSSNNKINSPTPRMISRNMNASLHQQQDQNDTETALSIGPLSMVPFPGASSPGTEPPTIPFLRTSNGRHYILTLHVTKEFFPPICLVVKGLKELYFSRDSHCQEFP